MTAVARSGGKCGVRSTDMNEWGALGQTASRVRLSRLARNVRVTTGSRARTEPQNAAPFLPSIVQKSAKAERDKWGLR
eukprot:53451-Eustigmatos_ZCMA.PRE.1